MQAPWDRPNRDFQSEFQSGLQVGVLAPLVPSGVHFPARSQALCLFVELSAEVSL